MTLRKGTVVATGVLLLATMLGGAGCVWAALAGEPIQRGELTGPIVIPREKVAEASEPV